MRTVIFALVGLVGLGGVCCGAVTRIDWEIQRDTGSEPAFTMIELDQLHPFSLRIPFTVTSATRNYGLAELTDTIGSVGNCEYVAGSFNVGVNACNVDFSGLPRYDFGPFVNNAYSTTDAIPRITAATYTLGTGFYQGGETWLQIESQEWPLVLVGTETFATLGDVDHDGSVDAADAALLFSEWGSLDKYFGHRVIDAASAGDLFEQWTGDVAFVPEPCFPAALILLAIRYPLRWSSLSHRRT